MDDIPAYITTLVSLGMAVAFLRADPKSPSSRALAVALAFAALSIISNHVLVEVYSAGRLPAWGRFVALTEVFALIAIYQFVLSVRGTLPEEAQAHHAVGLLRIAQATAVAYGMLALALPELRMSEFLQSILVQGVVPGPGLYLFAAPLVVGMVCADVALVLVLLRSPDRAERTRLFALGVAIPLAASGLVLPQTQAALGTALGLVVLLAGALQYHVMQGRRATFMARFLSPQVAQLVQAKGMDGIIRDTRTEISIVCCDLRGFTAFAQQRPSDVVIATLRRYYDTVGDVVTRYEATIKDYAGDGILILIGTPLPAPDHAVRAIELAYAIRKRWNARRTLIADLPIGIGVATGTVSIGVVGGRGRLEYAAVGSAVNLASRLCEQAGPGEILADEVTVQRAQGTGHRFRPRPPARIEGVGDAVPSFAMDDRDDASHRS